MQIIYGLERNKILQSFSNKTYEEYEPTKLTNITSTIATLHLQVDIKKN